MSFERDFYEERRRKWRRSAFWRGVLFTLLTIVALSILGAYFVGLPPMGQHIAKVEIEGVIYDDPFRDEVLKDLALNDDAAALIVKINSPGGTTVGSEALFVALREIAAQKPVVAVLGEIAASGGYIAAISADHIIARGNTLTGSIGVIMEYPDVTELMSMIGVSLETVRSSALKGGPSPFRKTSDMERAADQLLIEDSFVWFRNLVSERRGLTGNALEHVASGGVFSGRMALENGLIDALGGESEAVEYLESLEGVSPELSVETYEIQSEDLGVDGILGKILSQNSVLKEITRHSGPRLYSQTK